MERKRRKLLAASVGIAAVSYVVGVACSDSTTGSNNPTSGNLPAPPPTDAAQDVGPDQTVISGNLPAPPPPDAGDAGDAGDAADATDDGG